MTTTTIDDVIERLDRANELMLRGNPEPWKALVTRAEDLTLLGAYGGHARGPAEVLTRFDRVAATYGGGGTTRRENVATWVGTDLACVVDLEHHRSVLDGGAEPTDFVYRTTHVLRREDGEWRVVLRHADPLGTFLGPRFAHHDAQQTPLTPATTAATGGPATAPA